MNVVVKVQVFKEIVFNQKRVPSFSRFCCPKMGHFALFAFLRGIFQCLWKTASLKQNLTYRKGKSDMVIHQYASSYFVSRRHIFVILQNFSSLFWRNQLVRSTCTVQVITLLISTVMWPSGIGGKLFRSMHTEILLQFGFDTGMWLLFFLVFL